MFAKGQIVRVIGTEGPLYSVRNLLAARHQVVKLRNLETGKRAKIAGTRLEDVATKPPDPKAEGLQS